MFSNVSLAVSILALSFASSADAALLQATRPGVMCTSPGALAKLSLPDGSSRDAAPNPAPSVAAIAKAGGCIDFPKGNVAILLTPRHNTSIVRSDTLTGDGVLDTFVVPNIDYAPYSPPHDPALDGVRSLCPRKFETFAVLGVPASDFIQSLPHATRDQIEKAIDGRCGGARGCTDAAVEDEIDNRHLEPQRVAFACRHP